MKTFEFEVTLSVSDYYDAPHGFEFEWCRGDRETALEVAAGELLEAEVSQEVLDRLQMTATFAEFDSPNPSHAAGYFKICLTGDDADVGEVEQLYRIRDER